MMSSLRAEERGLNIRFELVKIREGAQTYPAFVPSPASPLSRALQSARTRTVLSIAAKSSGPTGTSLELKARSSASDRVKRVKKRWTRDC